MNSAHGDPTFPWLTVNRDKLTAGLLDRMFPMMSKHFGPLPYIKSAVKRSCVTCALRGSKLPAAPAGGC